MKKIATVFHRDESNPVLVTRQIRLECTFVLQPTTVGRLKLDGSACLVRGGQLYKRRSIPEGKPVPPDFISEGFDLGRGVKQVGWVPVNQHDKYHLEAFAGNEADGTYELVGPMVQGGIEGAYKRHTLVRHDTAPALFVHTDMDLFDELQAFFKERSGQLEGLVFYGVNGELAKIKARDFGFSWGKEGA